MYIEIIGHCPCWDSHRFSNRCANLAIFDEFSRGTRHTQNKLFYFRIFDLDHKKFSLETENKTAN